jgi:hypothetical protein
MPINKRNIDRSGLLGAPVPQKTVYEVDAEIYGAIEKVDIGRQVAEPISIMTIFPDPTQPRRAIPSSVRAGWNGSPALVGEMFSEWWREAHVEMGVEFDLRAWVTEESTSNDDETTPDETAETNIGALEASLRVVAQLAASIRRDGLTNPVTVARRGDQYQLETGERRWLAYHLLYWLLQDDQWSKIPARVVEAVNVWRQASENAARQDLNAIGRARQYAVLLMDLWKHDEKAPREFKSMDECDTDQAYYAQVLGLATPYGKGDKLLSALNVTHRSAVDRYKTLLELPDEWWQKGDDENLSERELFNISAALKQAVEVSVVSKPTMLRARNNALRGLRQSSDKLKTRALQLAPKISPEERAEMADFYESLANEIRKFGV